MTAPMTQEELLALAQRIKLALSDDRELTGIACKHGFDLAVCAAKECENPYAIEPLLEQAEKALRCIAQKPSIDPADLWERYLAETKNPSPQGAMAFAVEALSNQGASK